MNNNNILLITDDENQSEIIHNKLILLRNSDRMNICTYKDAKKNIESFPYCIFILHCDNNDTFNLKLIKFIKDANPNSEIILFLNKINSELILKAYDAGIFDFITPETENWEILIKFVNCFKSYSLKEENSRNKKFLDSFGLIDNKNGLYKYNYLKDIFFELSDDLRIKNGVFAILTLSDKIKTKISTNRLGITIKNNIRSNDIVASARGGLFYVIIPDIDLNGAKEVIQKIQDKMGKDLEIRSGITRIGSQTFETLDKNAKNSLESARQNEELSVSLTDNLNSGETWLEEDNKPSKNFKLFQSAYENKLNNVITPIFFRFQKECETKLINTQISQYANNIECVFSLKNDKLHSELIIRHNGFAKLKIEITHSGLDSAENTKIELPLNKLTEKELLKLLKQLRTEYKQG